MLDRITEFFIFGFAPMVVVMLAAFDGSVAAVGFVFVLVVFRVLLALR